MLHSPEHNFAGQLVQRLGADSSLVDAPTGETIGSPELQRLIAGFGASLLARGLRGGDRIIICCAVSPASSIAYLGSMYAGLVPVPVQDRVWASSFPELLKRTGARAVWTEERRLIEGFHDPGIQTFYGLPAERQPGLMPPAICEPHSLAVLVPTSGSMGAPRLVMVSHSNLAANTEAIVRSQRLAEGERAMLILPLSYCFGASVLHTHLYQGGAVVFDSRFMFPDKVLRAINQYGCTTFAGVPTVYNVLLRRSNIRSIPMPGLRRFLQAGGPLAPQQIAQMCAVVPTAKFYVMYGQTEATARISCLDPEQLSGKLGSVGLPLDNLAVRIADDDGVELPPGQVGEVLVKGPSITLGYLDEPDETRRVFQNGWLRTGDLGHTDADGYLWIDGRKRAFLKMRGVRVAFAEVEAKVSSVPGVYECAAAAVAHPEAGEALSLYIVPDDESPGITDRVRRSLPPHWSCESITVVTEIPKTAHGKISRVSTPPTTAEA